MEAVPIAYFDQETFMEAQTLIPAPDMKAVAPTPPTQSVSAQTAPAPAAVPVHGVQAALAAKTPAHVPPAATVVPPVSTASTPAVANPVKDVVDNNTVGHNTPIDSEAEAKLSSEIAKLWGNHKNGNAAARRTRAELKVLRLELGAKLFAMKAILVGTGREGGWAPYLRSQELPISTADRYVARHEAALAPKEEKLTTGELSTPTVEEIRQLAQKVLPKVRSALITQELVYEFVHELVWNIDVAEAWYTDKGFEIPKIGSDHAPEPDAPIAVSAEGAPVAE
jgi:hypothetical protein